MLQRSATWVGTTARDIARAVRRGDTSATAVVADHLDSIIAHDRIINSFRLVRSEAVAEAEIVDEQPDLGNLALAGVPIAVKENTAVTGLPIWNGSNAARQPVADNDHEVVRRLRGAGAIVLGVTRMSELGIFGATDDVTGVTRNPWRTDRTPGGSSGGSAAAVSAGLIPLAHGTDRMGSVLIPAACCGLVGMRPGWGVVPSDTPQDERLTIGEHGILATTIADAALGFFVLEGKTPQRLVPPHRLRVACSLRSPIPGVFPDSGARRAFSDAGRALVSLGHDLVASNPSNPTAMGLRGFATWLASAYTEVQAGNVDVRDLQPRSRQHVLLGRFSLSYGLVREVDRSMWRERLRDWFVDNGFDVLVTPALAAAPPQAVEWSVRSWLSNMSACMRYAPYAAPWSLAGFPAIVVPIGVRSDGLPSAVQLVGPPGSELTLLAIAGQLEQHSPWRRYAPGWPRPVGHRWRG